VAEAPSEDNDADREAVTLAQFNTAKNSRGHNSRLCGNLDHLHRHISSMETSIKHACLCAVCGEPAHSKCQICGMYLHYLPNRGSYKGATCYIDYHNDMFFGLAKSDCKLVNKCKGDWRMPSSAKKRRNGTHIGSLEGPPTAEV
jgi:hypothetical protein